MNVKEPGARSDSAASDVPISQPVPLSSVVNDEIHINKASVASLARRMANRVDMAEEDWISRLITAIKHFLARLYLALLPMRYAQGHPTEHANKNTSSETNSLPLLSENEEECVVKGLPKSAFERIHRTVSEMVDAVAGERLPHSLKTALSMPELEQRQAFRVLLEQNFSDTTQIREMSAVLQSTIEEKVMPFAREYDLEMKVAVDILRADMENEEGVIAKRVDSSNEVRRHIDELKHLESALVGLAKARGMICTCALKSGVYTRDELREFVEEAGLASTFLYQHEGAAMAPELRAKAEDGKVISIEKYRAKTIQPREAANQSTKEERAECSVSVRPALTKLVEQGVIKEKAAEELEQAAVLDAALSDEAEFDVDIQGDELDHFFQRHNVSKPVPK